MWLAVLVFLIAVFAAIGGTLAGGAFTIVLIPVAAIAVLTAIGSVYVARASQSAESRRQKPGDPSSVDSPNALPRTHAHSPGHVQASPEQLVDARREAQ
jgi:hypothetical protein